MINPWVILGIVLAWGASLVSVGIWQHEQGAVSQNVADQKVIDSVREGIDKNKQIANAKLANALSDVIAVQVERDKIKSLLLQEHQINAETTNKLRDAYSAYGLRFRSDAAGCGASGANTMPAEGNTPRHDVPAVCQLSDATAKSLREIAFDADRLRDDYKLLYDWANK